MRLVELGSLSERCWDELIAGEHEPVGSVDANLLWREKTRNVGEFGFVGIDAPGMGRSARGRIEMPLPAMWSALDSDANWPGGRIELMGEPF